MGAAVRLPPNEREYRDTVGLFSTGVAVIVANIDGEVFAMTVNAVASLSLSPKLIMFAPGKHTRFAQRIGELKHYSINVLRSEQQALSTYFAAGRQARRSDSKGAWRVSNARACNILKSAIIGW